MLAIKSKIALAIIIGAVSINGALTHAQQTPAQRYQPLRNAIPQTIPPSVHVAPQQARPLRGSQPSPTATQYTFSDSAPLSTADSSRRSVQSGRNQVMQTTYLADDQAPSVPEILASSSNPNTEQLAVQNKANSPNQFAAQMNQIRSSTTQVSTAAQSDQESVRNEIAAFRQKMLQRQQAVTPINDLSTPKNSTRSAFPKTEPVANETSAPAVSTPQAEPIVSAAEFIAATTDTQPTLQSAPSSLRDGSAVQQTSAISDTTTGVAPGVALSLASPAIEVETIGPQTVGIDKPAVYKVIINNNSQSNAEFLMAGIDVPAWVDLENLHITTGTKELTSSNGKKRLTWRVDQISGRTQETLTLTAIPRKAELFDLAVEWTLVPRTGSASIEVTQPKLAMNIVGPEEVQYGEQALYHVTVSNPGTGTAENVTVMLPEALGGERAKLGPILPGEDKNFQVELLARTAGEMILTATAVGENNLEASVQRQLIVRRAQLAINIQGPSLKYAGGNGKYQITITNSGDATATEVVAAVALPAGVNYLSGIDSAKTIEGGLRWLVGSLDAGQSRQYQVNCQLDAAGDLQLEVGVQGKGELQAASACVTKVDTIADLVLSVEDPKGPLPTGQETTYEIKILNRGTRSAEGVKLVMLFSEGIEPRQVSGAENRIVPGQVLFAPIKSIEPGQEISFQINAEALNAGTHVFRAQLDCEQSESHEIAEGTTRFFGDTVQSASQTSTADADTEFGQSEDSSNDFTR